MKKLIILTVILLGMTIGSSAQGGLFGRGESTESFGSLQRGGESGNLDIILPDVHGSDHDTDAPLNEGTILLLGFGAAFLAATKLKSNKEKE